MEKQVPSKITATGLPAKRLGGPLPIRTIINRCFPRPGINNGGRLSTALMLCLAYVLFLGMRSKLVDQHRTR